MPPVKRCYSCDHWKPDIKRNWISGEESPDGMCTIKNKPKTAEQLCDSWVVYKVKKEKTK